MAGRAPERLREEEQKRSRPGRKRDQQVQNVLPTSPPSALEKVQHAGNSESRGGLSGPPAPRWSCLSLHVHGCDPRPASGRKSGTPSVSLSDVGPCSWGNTQAATRSRTNSGISLTPKQPRAVTRMAWPHHKKIQTTTRTTKQISNRSLWQA